MPRPTTKARVATQRGEPAIFGLTERVAGLLRGEASAAWPELPAHQVQKAFLACRETIKGFVGGRGAGKSWVSAYDLCLRAKSDRLYVVFGPTYGQLVDSTVRSFLEVARTLGILQKFVKTPDFYAIIDTQDGGTAQVNFRSASNPERSRGPNISGACGDEASLCPEEYVQNILASLREGREMGWLSLTFTPKGRDHWTYDWFHEKDEAGNVTRREKRPLFHAKTIDNEFLPPEFYAVVASQYIPGTTLARQELDGEFVDMTGLQFLRRWFDGRIVRSDQVPREAKRVRYWDKAASDDAGDYTVGALVARSPDGIYWIEHLIRGQWTPYTRDQKMKLIAQRDAADYNGEVGIWIEQEPGSGGKESALLSLALLDGYPVRINVERQKKVAKAQPFRAHCEAGLVRLVDGSWLRDFMDELCAFPEGRHDDQVDAVVGAYNKLAVGAVVALPEQIVAYPTDDDAQNLGSAPKPETSQDANQPEEADRTWPMAENDFTRYLQEYSGQRQEPETYQQRLNRYMFGE